MSDQSQAESRAYLRFLQDEENLREEPKEYGQVQVVERVEHVQSGIEGLQFFIRLVIEGKAALSHEQTTYFERILDLVDARLERRKWRDVTHRGARSYQLFHVLYDQVTKRCSVITEDLRKDQDNQDVYHVLSTNTLQDKDTLVPQLLSESAALQNVDYQRLDRDMIEMVLQLSQADDTGLCYGIDYDTWFMKLHKLDPSKTEVMLGDLGLGLRRLYIDPQDYKSQLDLVVTNLLLARAFSVNVMNSHQFSVALEDVALDHEVEEVLNAFYNTQSYLMETRAHLDDFSVYLDIRGEQ